MSMLLRRSAQLAQTARSTVGRSISTSPISRKDLVQDLYLNQLKAYKAPPAAKDAHVGAVKTFSEPPAPQAPAAPTNLAAELSAYDAAEPVLAASGKAPASSEEAAGAGAQAYLAFLEQDLPKHEAHH